MPAPTKTQLIGGHFQDAEGNILALGTLLMELVQDEQLSSSTGQVCGGIKIRLSLDSTGSVSVASAQSVWPTDVMTPSNASYTAWVYAADGQLAWGPNYNLLVPSTPNPYDIDNWIPNSISGGSGSGGGGVGGVTLQTNGVNNGSQALLNLEAGSNITLVDNGSGEVTISAIVPTPTVSALGNRFYNLRLISNSPTPTTIEFGLGGSINNNDTSNIVPSATHPAMRPVGSVQSSSSQAVYFDSVAVDSNMTARSIILLTALPWTNVNREIMVPIGASDQTLNSLPTNFLTVGNTIGFYLGIGAETNWQAFVTAAGVATVVDTSVAAVLSTMYTFQFVVNFSAGTVTFSINGAVVATIHAMPATGTLLNVGTWDTNDFTTIGNMYFSLQYFEAY